MQRNSMSKIDIYSKFISKQSKIAENSSISRSIKEAEEDKGKDTSDAKKKLDDMKIKDLEDKAKKAGIDFDNPDMKSAADANSGNVTAATAPITAPAVPNADNNCGACCVKMRKALVPISA